jgi:hypothetical protein
MSRKRPPPCLSQEHCTLAWAAFCFIAYGIVKRMDPQRLVDGMQWMIDNKMVERIDP